MTLLLHSASAFACTVCFVPTEANRQAFLDTTMLLTLMPLILMGGGAYWLYRQYQAAEESPYEPLEES